MHPWILGGGVPGTSEMGSRIWDIYIFSHMRVFFYFLYFEILKSVFGSERILDV